MTIVNSCHPCPASLERTTEAAAPGEQALSGTLIVLCWYCVGFDFFALYSATQAAEAGDARRATQRAKRVKAFFMVPTCLA